jgi:23S rRNA-/tRNA-specific pseudouridylate synthase
LRECSQRLNRQALHAHRLAFIHPRTNLLHPFPRT